MKSSQTRFRTSSCWRRWWWNQTRDVKQGQNHNFWFKLSRHKSSHEALSFNCSCSSLRQRDKKKNKSEKHKIKTHTAKTLERLDIWGRDFSTVYIKKIKSKDPWQSCREEEKKNSKQVLKKNKLDSYRETTQISRRETNK